MATLDNNSVKERLSAFIKSQNLSVRKFEIMCGLPNAFISNMKRSISPDRLITISNKFPQLNITWLMTGNGEMLLQPTPSATNGDAFATPLDTEAHFGRLSEYLAHTIEQFAVAQNTVNAHNREFFDRFVDIHAKLCQTLEEEHRNISALLSHIERLYQHNEKLQTQNEALIEQLRNKQ